MRFSLDIVNEKGLHARASAKFVETVERFDARAQVSRDGMEVSGDSIMGLMMLGRRLRAPRSRSGVEGTEAEALAAALRALVAGPVRRADLRRAAGRGGQGRRRLLF